MSAGALAFMAGEATNLLHTGPGRYVDVGMNHIFPVDIPSPDSLVLTWLKGYMSDESIANGMGHNAVMWEPLNRNVFSYTFIGPGEVLRYNDHFMTVPMKLNQATIVNDLEIPTIDESIVMRRRGLIDDSLFNFIVSQKMNGEDAWTIPYKDLLFEIPGPQDLVRFAVRDAFTQSIIEAFGEAQEIPKVVLPWMEKQGFGGRVGIDLPENATYDDGSPARGPMKWFHSFWVAHWELPSPTQGYEMQWRLYGHSDYGPSPDYRPEIAFGQADLNRLLKTADYSPYWRGRLEAISYRPYTRVDIRRMYSVGILDDAGVYHAYRAIGYNDKRAKELLAFTKSLDATAKSKKKILRNNTWVCKHYANGVLSEQEAREMLKKNGLSGEDADYFVKTCQLEERTRILNQAIKDVKSAYMAGSLASWQVNQILYGLGVETFKIDQLLKNWQLHLTLVKKQLSASQNIGLYLDGILADGELIARLQNLGFTSADITLMMTQARRKRINESEQRRIKDSKEAAKEIEKVQKAKDKAAKDKAKQVEDEHKRQIKGLLSASTDKNMIAWFKAGLITKDDIKERLSAKDWKEDDINNWIETNIPDETEATDNGETS